MSETAPNDRIKIIIMSTGEDDTETLDFRSRSHRLSQDDDGTRLRVPKESRNGLEVELVAEPPLLLIEVKDKNRSEWEPVGGAFVSAEPVRYGQRLELHCKFFDPSAGKVSSGVGYIHVDDEGGGGL